MKLRQALFWDVRPEKIDLKKNASYVVGRVLEYGKDSDIRWLLRTYDADTIRRTMEKSRAIGPKTKSLWRLLIPRK